MLSREVKSVERNIVVGLLVALVVALYLFVDPAITWWMPKCLFHTITGYECPGCGNQRVLHSLLEGNLHNALRYNPFTFVVMPYIILVGYTTFCHTPRAEKWRKWTHNRYIILLFVVLTVAWWILRNTELWSPQFV